MSEKKILSKRLSLMIELFAVLIIPSLIGLSLFVNGCALSNTAANAIGNAIATATPVPGASATPTPTPAGGMPTVVQNISKFSVTVQSNTNYTTIVSKNGDGVTPCTATAGNDILCVIDMQELDIFMRGYTIIDQEPAAMCYYRSYYPYFYNVAPVGNEPVAVSYALDATGNVIGDIFYAIPNGISGTIADVAHASIFGAAAQKPTDLACPFDYTAAGRGFPLRNGRNCCYGPYTLYVTDSTGKTTHSSVNWTGKHSNCFDGPGIDDNTLPLHSDGMPARLLSNIDSSNTGGGLSTTFTVVPPITKTAIGEREVYAVNWFTGALQGTSSLRTPFKNFPAPAIPSALLPSGAAPWVAPASAYFTYECLDQAEELVARIRVAARRWTTNSEFVKFQNGQAANPDLRGTETSPTQSDPSDPSYPPGPLNDYCDYNDIAQYSALIGSDPNLFICQPATLSNFGFSGGATYDALGLGVNLPYYLGFGAPF